MGASRDNTPPGPGSDPVWSTVTDLGGGEEAVGAEGPPRAEGAPRVGAEALEEPGGGGPAGSSQQLLYEAESPDELALVQAARAYGCTLRGRAADGLMVELPGAGGRLHVPLLHVLPFDCARRRMSVVVRHPLTGRLVLFTKGADSVIMELSQHPHGERRH